MKQTELTAYDLQNLNETAEYIVSSAQFSLYQYNGEGEYILSELSREERQVALDKWVTGMEENYLCFRINRELRKRTFQDALYILRRHICKIPMIDLRRKLHADWSLNLSNRLIQTKYRLYRFFRNGSRCRPELLRTVHLQLNAVILHDPQNKRLLVL